MVTDNAPESCGRRERPTTNRRSDSSPAVPNGLGFPKILRLRKRREFDRVFARKCSVSGSCLIIYACENDYGFPRLGPVVSRKCGKSVVRNRWKRLMREVFRINRNRIQTGVDLVMIPRRGSNPDFATMNREFVGLVRRLIGKLRRTAAPNVRKEPGECS